MQDLFQSGTAHKDLQKCAVQKYNYRKKLCYTEVQIRVPSSTQRKLCVPKGNSLTRHVCAGFFFPRCLVSFGFRQCFLVFCQDLPKVVFICLMTKPTNSLWQIQHSVAPCPGAGIILPHSRAI